MKLDRISFKYLMWFAFPVFTFYLIAIPLSIFFAPVSGDLTRIGDWSERDFGWQKTQPTVVVHVNGVPNTDPQVLVLGDSFSHPNIWQSALAQSRNLQILSFQYQDVGCVDNWLHWVGEKHYPNVHTVVIETVERGFVTLFKDLNTCANRMPKPTQIAGTVLTPTRPHKGLTLDAAYLASTGFNTLRAASGDGRIVSRNVINVQLSTDKLFSNRKADRLLYYSEDELKKDWLKKDLATAVGKLKSIQTDLEKKGLRLVVIVVPDKSSAYRHYLADEASRDGYPDVFGQLKAAGVNNVDLLNVFQQAVGKTIDLYLPNDTHLSTQGYKLMASKVADEAF